MGDARKHGLERVKTPDETDRNRRGPSWEKISILSLFFQAQVIIFWYEISYNLSKKEKKGKKGTLGEPQFAEGASCFFCQFSERSTLAGLRHIRPPVTGGDSGSMCPFMK
jgi:hypothetical protein